ncbi:WavQ [Enterobacter kobei]|uniref:WavQ n=1 Tax=Enterobacter kobei TaxID=208224 RepID=UPI0032B0192C
MKVFICAPSFDENSGGSVVLHRLCHIINEFSQHDAFLVQLKPSYSGKITCIKLLQQLKWMIHSKSCYKTHPEWNTPLWNAKKIPEDSVVVYPEIVNGNPLSAKHVVRWLLHQPGFHTSIINYEVGEMYYKFNSAIKDFHRDGSFTSQRELKVIYYPIDIYNESNDVKDIDCCFMVRKGTYKEKIHPANAVQIDGLGHKEVASIFKRSKRFICYDDYTAYSIFAVLCGCPSYVVPAQGQSIEDWYPNLSDRYGISFGFSKEQEEWAERTRENVYNHILAEHQRSTENVQCCLNEMADYFKLR